jgi:Tfp pilus assembly protein PilZ
MLRVPFVQACSLAFAGGPIATAMIVNINVLGVYVAADEFPAMGQAVNVRFRTPGTEIETEIQGVVAWLNPRQAHPVHSLPPGFGVKFASVPDVARGRIEEIVREYTARRQPGR